MSKKEKVMELKKRHIVIPYKGGYKRIKKSEIVYIETASFRYRKSIEGKGHRAPDGFGNYTHITTTVDCFTVALKLGDIEKMLKLDGFERSHQSILINMRYAEMILEDDGTRVELTTGAKLPVSTRYKGGFVKAFKG